MGYSLSNLHEAHDLSVDFLEQNDKKKKKYINRTLIKKPMLIHGDDNVDDIVSY